MRETSSSTVKVFVLFRYDIGACKTALSVEVKRLCQAHEISLGSLRGADALALIQAIAKGCQVITYDEDSMSGPSASFLAAAAFAAYRITFVVSDMTDAAAGIQHLLGQQGTCGSTCKVLQVQPGREALVAAAALAPILLGEAILGPGQPGNAAAAKHARSAQAQGQQADGQGAVPLMLPAPPPQEAADASSGQTQHFLNGALQPEPGNGEMQRAEAAEGMHQDAEGGAALVAAPAQDSRPAVQKRGRRAQKAERKAADRDRAQFTAKRNISAAALEIKERSKPASEGPAAAAAKWPTTKKRTRKSEEPEGMENGNENADSPSDEQLKAEVEKVLDGIDNAFSMKDLLTELQKRFKVSLHRRKPFLKQTAASYLADKQERNDGEHLAAAEVAVEATAEAAANQPVKGAKAGKRVPSPAKAPLQQPGAQVQEQVEIVDLISDSDDGRSSMPASQAALQDDGVSAPREGCRKEASMAPAARVRRSARISSQCSSDASDGETERECKRSKAWLAGCKKKSKVAQAQPEVPQRKRSRLGSGQKDFRQVAAAPTGKARHVVVGAASAGDWSRAEPLPSSQARRHERAVLEQRQSRSCCVHQEALPTAAEVDSPVECSTESAGLLQHHEPADMAPQSQAACPGAASPSSAPANKTPPPGAQSSPGEAARESVTLAKQKAGTPSQAAAQSLEPDGKSRNDTPSKAVLPFSQKVIGGLLEQFNQNRILCSQASPSPGKDAKWKGKEKVCELEEPRDPEQPGPSNAVYRSAPQEAAVVDSDDESIVLSEPLI